MSDLIPSLSPSDRRWLDRLALELRLLDVDGETIGDVLAEAETHLLESGESPEEAFGDPAVYAAEMRREEAPDKVASPGARRAGVIGLLGVAFAGVAGYLAVMLGVRAALGLLSGVVPLTVGDAASTALLVVAVVVLVGFLGPLLRSRWRFVVWFAVSFTGTVAAGVLLKAPLVQLGTPLAFALAAALALVALVVLVRRVKADPIRDPRRR